MKNVLLTFLVFCVVGAFAQPTHTVDFEPGGTGSEWEWTVTENADNPPLEFMANPDNAGINTSATTAKFIARVGGNPWALCFTDDNGEFTFDASNAIVKIMVYKSTLSPVAVKFEGLSPAKEIQITNTLTGEWEELTYDFSDVIGNTYNRLVIIPDFQARTEDQVVYFDNIQVPEGVINIVPEPTDTPPVPPHAEEDVISVYTEAYPNIGGVDFNPNWGQSTTVTVDYVAAGNNTIKYENLNYQGTQFANMDVSDYEFLHVDFWTPNSTMLNFYVISPGNETPYTLPIQTETWVSVDIPLSDFVPPVDLADVFQFKVDGNGTVYFDNWYFWKEPYNPDTDATLSDLQVDGETIDGFAPSTLSYDVVLPAGTVDVPAVTATTTVEGAEAVVNDAASLPGTTEVVVTATDGETQQTYSVNFTVEQETPESEYCETLVYHFGDPNIPQSAIYLTITNQDANTVFVEIESAGDTPVDLLIVTGESGAAISEEDFSVPGKISRTMFWDTPPADVELNVLWSFEDFGGNWQLSPTPITVPFDAACAPPGPTMITFRVDMSDYADPFTNVYVSGSFNDWSGTANQLLDTDSDNIYEGEFEIADGNYEYKFTLDNWTVQEEFNGSEPCVITIGGFSNRELIVDGSEVLPAYCWNSCYECGMAPVDVTFSVDMNNYQGNYENVYLSGSFNGWCGDCNMMEDPEMDGIYETTITVLPGNYEYKFTLDNWTAQELFNGGESCTIESGGFVNRYIEITESMVVPTVCWNLCVPCPEPVDVTFSVDMSQFEGDYTNVYLSGSLNGWCGDCNQMTDPDMDLVYEITLPLVPGAYEYKFTLDNWTVQEEFEGGEPCTVTNGGFTNRYIEVEESAVLPLVCWNRCTECPDYFAGWGGISSNLVPEEKATMEEIFEPILEDIVIMVSNEGIFWPGFNINTIGDWDTYKGYKIKFAEDVLFEFSGVPVEDKTLALEPGLHYIPVLSDEAVPVEDVLAPHADAIVFAFDMTQGSIYWPDGGIVPGVPGALEMLEPGYAYFLQVSEAFVLDYGVETKTSGGTNVAQPVEYPNGWNHASITGSQHIISVNTASLAEGDVVGVFNQDGTCTGIAQYSGSGNMMPLVVAGDDQTTKNVDGMIESEMMSFRIYSNGVEENVQAVYDGSFNSDGRFVENGLSIINDFKAGATGIGDSGSAAFSIFPNPNNGQFYIQVAGDSDYDVVVLNVQGQQIFSANLNRNTAIDLGNQPKGVYFVRVSNDTSVSMQKIIVE